jgi:hypothetical protein
MPYTPHQISVSDLRGVRFPFRVTPTPMRRIEDLPERERERPHARVFDGMTTCIGSL